MPPPDRLGPFVSHSLSEREDVRGVDSCGAKCRGLPERATGAWCGTVTENQIQRRILDALAMVPGLRIWRNNTGRRGRVTYGLCRGSADLIGLVNGRFVALEVKTPRGKTTEDQEAFMQTVWQHGGFATVVTSVEQALEAIERARGGAKK